MVFSYSDVSHEHVMHAASRVLAAGANFTLLGPTRHDDRADVPAVAVMRRAHRRRQEPDDQGDRRAC